MEPSRIIVKLLNPSFPKASSKSRRTKRESGKKSSTSSSSKKKGNSKIQVDVVDMLPAGDTVLIGENYHEESFISIALTR